MRAVVPLLRRRHRQRRRHRPNDAKWDMLQAMSLQARENPAVWLGMASAYGDLGRHSRLTKAFARHLIRLWPRGTAATLADYRG
jgi:hypothetical protein